MEYGLIKDTTITSIADGLRDKGIINPTRDEFVDYISYMSPNATSLDDPTPVHDGSYSIDVNIPEATSLEFVFHVGYYSANKLAAGNLEVASDSYKPYSKRIESSTDRTLTTKIDPFYGNSLTVKLSSYGNAQTMCAITFEVYPLDVDGNRMQVLRPSDITNTVTPEEMAEAINNMLIAPPESAFTITGDCRYRFAKGGWDWFIDQYGDKIVTSKIDNLNYTFHESTVSRIPFVININDLTGIDATFNSMENLIECPKIRGQFRHSSPGNIKIRGLQNCYRVRDFTDLFEPEMLDFCSDFVCTSAYSIPQPTQFQSCYSLRNLPNWFYKFTLSRDSTAVPSTSYSLYSWTFYQCYSLDEIRNLAVWSLKAAVTTSLFSYFVDSCSRLKAFTFETENGQPVVTKWKSQTLDMSSYIGYASNKTYIIGYNSGITADKEVIDDATYQALKNDPDWFTTKIEYSRYNHDSAVETINSLPDTSAYLATAGGTNTIKFLGSSGEKTDAGAINTLTAEEIAVAAAKGWTVSLV